jgi:aspartyl protease family protein
LGFVRVKGWVGRSREETVEIEFLIDTVSFYTVIPPAIAENLGIRAVIETELILANKGKVKAGVTMAYMKLLDRDGALPVAIMEVPEPLLGVTALEGLGLRVDPVTGKLEYSRPYGLAAI